MPEPVPPSPSPSPDGVVGGERGLPPPPSPPVFSWSAGEVVARLRGLRTRAGVGVAAVGVVAAVVVVVALVWGTYRAGLGGGDPPPEASLPRVGSAGDPSASSSSTSSSTTEVSAEVVAHVAGAVVRPGLYTLPPGVRVADALAAAGGAAADADVDALNLAAPVDDGERIYVPRKDETPPAVAAPASPGGSVAAAVAVLDLNKATADELDRLPGIGPSTAAAIVAYRAENGRFRSVDELLEVRGIGPSKLAALRPKVRVK